MTAATKLPVLQRPRTRGECTDVPRPCPFVECRYNLTRDMRDKRGKTGKVTESMEAEFFGLRAAGQTIIEASRSIGIDKCTADRIIARNKLDQRGRRYSCALDAAEDGPMEVFDIAYETGLCENTVRKTLVSALAKARLASVDEMGMKEPVSDMDVSHRLAGDAWREASEECEAWVWCYLQDVGAIR